MSSSVVSFAMMAVPSVRSLPVTSTGRKGVCAEALVAQAAVSTDSCLTRSASTVRTAWDAGAVKR
jgi:hypothetical protein